MKILHSSDLHGKYKWLLRDQADADFDVWVDTGDFFDNVGRVARTNHAIHRETEKAAQDRWWGWKHLGTRFKEWLNGRPAIICSGNHDFIDLAYLLRRAGANVHVTRPEGVDVAGLTWAGFREINWISGEWAGELHDFSDLVDSTWATNPDVLVTHAPPAGILVASGDDDYGIPRLASALFFEEHKIKHHFFGHVHDTGGQQEEKGGIKFYNGATNVLIHEIEV